MKILLTVSVFLSIHLSILAQNEVFRIDSIPSKGILLDRGWKWHAGDNPDFAKPDFDDSKWEAIDPTKDVMDLPQIPRNGKIGWLRLKLKIDTSLTNSLIGASINQVGASEVYIDGKFLIKFGSISLNPNEIEAYNPSSEPTKYNFINSRFGNNTEVILAIRFVLQPNILYLKIFERPNPVLKIILKSAEDLNNNTIDSRGYDSSFSEYFRLGILFILGLLHFVVFIFYRKQKTNLYTSLYYIFSTLFFFTNIILHQHVHSVKFRMILSTLIYLLSFGMSLSIITTVYSLFQFRRGVVYWIIVLFPVPFFLFFIWDYKWSSILVTLFPIFMNIEAIRVTIVAIIRKKTMAWLMMSGVFGWTFFYALLILIRLFSNQNLVHILVLQDTLWSLSFLITPICITIILAREFANASNSLASKLIEVQQLSLEKQESLLKQNAELQAALLQGQTIERKRVAADLHDSLGSTMSSLIYTVNAIDTNKLDEQEKNVYRHLKQMLDTAYNEIRLLSHNLLPEEFEKQGLAEALRYFVRKINQTKTIQFDLSIDPNLGRLSPKIEFELYSICLELINNILKHSKATEAKINLSKVTPPLGRSAVAVGGLNLTISDNGRGFFDNESDGKGIKNVKARIESLDGTWHIQNLPDGGMSSEIVVPI